VIALFLFRRFLWFGKWQIGCIKAVPFVELAGGSLISVKVFLIREVRVEEGDLFDTLQVGCGFLY
jgi:hypothetical protein